MFFFSFLFFFFRVSMPLRFFSILWKGIARSVNHYLSCVLDITQHLCKSLPGCRSKLYIESFTRSKQVFYESLAFLIKIISN